MEWFNSILSWVMKKRIHQIELFVKYPHEVQNELFENLLKKAVNTEYGRKFGFGAIKNHEQYKNQVPIVSYEELFPYIDRLMKGEQNLLWSSEVKWFAKSSGTTNARSKFIPVSHEAMEDCHYKAGKDVLSIYFNNYPEAKMFAGKGLTISGSHYQNEFNQNSKSYYGDVSAVLLQNLPWWAQVARTPSLEVALMDEWESKIDKMVKITSEENVTNISGVPTWMIVLLEKIIEYKKVDSILDIWPNLEVFFHGAVSFTPYRNLFKKLIPKGDMRYMETYNASEGFFGIQDQTNSSEMLLMLDYGVFYEFIPLDEIDEETPKVLGLSEVKQGERYAVIISTNSGLWRYKIGDVVEFTSVNPYRIKISGRTKHFINAFGEELMVGNAELAIAEASHKTNATVADFTAGPIFMNEKGKGGHEWIIEFTDEPNNFERFCNLLDEKLREINSDYDAKRYKDIALKAPIIHKAPPKTFYNWMKEKKKLGGQHKVPRLANSRVFIEQILPKITKA